MASPLSNVRSKAYLAHCAISPLGRDVQARMRSTITHFAENGVHGYEAIADIRARLRVCASEAFGGSKDAYALIPNTSYGLNHIAHAIRWNKGDKIVLLEGEFPTNVRPWTNAASRYGLSTLWMPRPDPIEKQPFNLDALERILGDGVRLLSVSAVQFQTGLRLPLEAIRSLCKENGTLMCVDAIQHCGAIPFTGVDFDFWVTGGHKWLMGPEGTGLMFVNPRIWSDLNPAFLGWLSLTNPLNFLFDGPGLLDYDRPRKTDAGVFELGTLNNIGFAGLAAALETLNEQGIHRVYAKIQKYHDLIETPMTALGFTSVRAPKRNLRSGILSFLAPDGCDLPSLTSHCQSHGVIVTAPDGHLRIAPHFWNQEHEVGVVVDVVRAYLNEQKV